MGWITKLRIARLERKQSRLLADLNMSDITDPVGSKEWMEKLRERAPLFAVQDKLRFLSAKAPELERSRGKAVDTMKAAAETQADWHPLPFDPHVNPQMGEEEVDEWLRSKGHEPANDAERRDTYRKISAMIAFNMNQARK